MLIVNGVRYVVAPDYNLTRDCQAKYINEPEQTLDKFCDLIIKHQGYPIYRIEQLDNIKNYFNINVRLINEILIPLSPRYKDSDIGLAWFVLPSGRVLVTWLDTECGGYNVERNWRMFDNFNSFLVELGLGEQQ